MPTKRTRKSRQRIANVSPDLWAVLTDSDDTLDAGDRFFAQTEFRERGRELWAQTRDVILADWIKHKGGTRPQAWWLFDAPRLEYRRILGGGGRPAWERFAYVPAYMLGVPVLWCGRVAPLFESQHAYLTRHGLLFDGEQHMTDGPHVTPTLLSEPA